MTAALSDPPATPRRPELVAPAGDWQCAKAAVQNGADAVYFGLQAGFSARARATNFAAGELPELMLYLRRHGVKGYVTLNTLVFSDELTEFERTVRTVVAAGVDAVLVQDLGAARLIRQVCPTCPLHASTQMTLSSAECIGVAQSLGIARVVLPRELSLEEIASIRRQSPVALEVFVHGAICLSYSGQCLASAAIGGRSANRGECAQPCRLPYEIICDDRHFDSGDKKYPLSPCDLAAYDLLPELIGVGVDAVKIEGRLKTPNYVAAVTRCYRRAIDAAMAGRRTPLTPADIEELEVSFSRGFSHGWLEGRRHKALVPGTSSTKRGIYLGEVKAVAGTRVRVELAGSVKRGDGVVFAGQRGELSEQGGRVYEVFREGESLQQAVSSGLVELTFGRGAIDPARLTPGQSIFKTDDPQLARRTQQTYAADGSRRRVALDVEIEAAIDRPLRIVARAASGATCSLQSPQPLNAAVKHALTAELLRQQLGRLGGTVYELRAMTAKIEGRPMVALSVLGQMRHEMVRQLDASLACVPPRAMSSESALNAFRAALPRGAGCQAAVSGRLAICPTSQTAAQTAESAWQGAGSAQLHVLCRRLEQVAPAVACGVSTVIVDFSDMRECDEAARIAHDDAVHIVLATPRIHTPGQSGEFGRLASRRADGILARNLAALGYFRGCGVPVVADAPLNAANELTVQWLREQGAARVTPAYELSRERLLAMVEALAPECFEVLIYRHVPIFHSAHCVFCAMLSSGTDRSNCGQPCRQHAVRLRDRLGAEHVLKAEADCRNTVFHAAPRCSAELVPVLRAHGVRHFRMELLDETAPGQVSRLISKYRGLVD